MGPSRYRIVLQVAPARASRPPSRAWPWNPDPNQTVLVGEVRDQAQLYGLLDRLRDFGIQLVAVEPDGAADAGR